MVQIKKRAVGCIVAIASLSCLLLVLRHSTSSFAVGIRHNLEKRLRPADTRVDIVIAHSHEDLHALKIALERLLRVPFLAAQSARIYIYTKSGDANIIETTQTIFADLRFASIHVTQLVNKGREGHVRTPALLYQFMPIPPFPPANRFTLADVLASSRANVCRRGRYDYLRAGFDRKFRRYLLTSD